jgi:hypothetical protein
MPLHGDGTVRQLTIDVSGSGSVELDRWPPSAPA